MSNLDTPREWAANLKQPVLCELENSRAIVADEAQHARLKVEDIIITVAEAGQLAPRRRARAPATTHAQRPLLSKRLQLRWRQREADGRRSTLIWQLAGCRAHEPLQVSADIVGDAPAGQVEQIETQLSAAMSRRATPNLSRLFATRVSSNSFVILLHSTPVASVAVHNRVAAAAKLKAHVGISGCVAA
eukprot:CAMPEP_0183364658 /NCGR_PEP_ID=MMETSP0164_2-20130417/81249_1 /TAXON_ID=221442 /ORGANISM="Coccolithus pelagicus ssp braarudi, Strain PLY182g" /LENGTH=188 /DNA_ID=CAMNT_0025540011 /DNA_START=36 /DNA_END=603 /DNA_ORIENTATION=+